MSSLECPRLSKALDVLAKEGLAHESPGSGFLARDSSVRLLGPLPNSAGARGAMDAFRQCGLSVARIN